MQPKIITWKTAVVPAGGLALQNYLNAQNFQPGKFIVIPGLLEHQIIYVDEEREYGGN